MSDFTLEDYESQYQRALGRISMYLILYREKNKLTQSELAKRMKVSQEMISKIESGNYNISLAKVFKYMSYIERPVSDLFSDTADTTDRKTIQFELKKDNQFPLIIE